MVEIRPAALERPFAVSCRLFRRAGRVLAFKGLPSASRLVALLR